MGSLAILLNEKINSWKELYAEVIKYIRTHPQKIIEHEPLRKLVDKNNSIAVNNIIKA